MKMELERWFLRNKYSRKEKGHEMEEDRLTNRWLAGCFPVSGLGSRRESPFDFCALFFIIPLHLLYFKAYLWFFFLIQKYLMLFSIREKNTKIGPHFVLWFLQGLQECARGICPLCGGCASAPWGRCVHTGQGCVCCWGMCSL